MNFLQLVQALHRESGAAGNAPTTVTNQTGEANRMVNWIKQANMHVQSLWADWKFLRETDNRALTASVNTLTAPSGFDAGMWDLDTFRITPYGETLSQQILAMEYADVKTEDIDTTAGTPWRAVVMPDGSLRFEGTPDAADTFTADYYRSPDDTELAANADESSIPARFHNVILGRALVLYANYEGAEEIRTQGIELYTDYLARLENNQLPNKAHSRFRSGAPIIIQTE